MRNITVSVADETYKRARVTAAELAAHETENQRRKRREREVRSHVTAFTAADRVSREELHDRFR